MKKIMRGVVAFTLGALALAGCNGQANSTKVNNGNETNLDITKMENIDKPEFIDSMNKDLIKRVESLNQNDSVDVIITFSSDSLVSKYKTSNNSESIGDFSSSDEGLEFLKLLKSNQSIIEEQLISDKLVNSIKYSYSTLLDGVYATTTYGNIESIVNTPGVERVMISNTYAAPQVTTNPVQVYDTGIFDSSDVSYTGKGTVIAILDTGCDFTHTAFTSYQVIDPLMSRNEIDKILPDTVAFSYNNDLQTRDVYYSSKIPFGYDYADKDPDVMPYSSEHGTHVAGIIGGKDNTITGVAIDAQLAIMKVFSDYKEGANDGDILAALEDSVLLGVDAINMSLGTSCGFTREVDELYKNKLYDSIEDAGISLICAASNDYSSAYGSDEGNTNKASNPDSSTVGAPSTYNAAMSVASINGNKDKYMVINGDQTVFFHEAFNQSAKEYDFFSMLGVLGDTTKELEYVTIPGVGMTANYMGIDVKDKVALVKRGDISFEEKVQYASEAGAKAIIVYNNVFGDIVMTVGNNVKIPVVSISKDDGLIMAKQESGTLTLNANNQAGPFMSDFSSWGPTPSLELKPEITAHGGNILSSVPGGGYEKLSGTSMAAPNMAGVTILIRQYVKEKFPDYSTTQVRDLVNQLAMSTATIALDKNGNPYSPRKQGAGIASLSNSVSTDAYLYVENKNKTKIELGDDPERSGSYTFSFHVKNMSDKSLSYDMSNLFMTESLSTSDKDYVAEMAHMLSPKFEFSVEGQGNKTKNKVNVDSNGDAKITVTLNLSQSDRTYLNDNFKNGMFVEGFICLNSATGVSLNVPVLGFYGNWEDAPLFDKSYYEVQQEAYDSSIDDDDKIKADYYATTPFGRYYYDYIIPLGSYIYEIDTTKYDAIPATEEHAAVSYYKDSISGIYAVYTGLLRSAKELDITIVNTDTGEVVWSDVQYNCYKAHFSGTQYPYVAPIELEMADAVLDNNSHYEVTMNAKLDWDNSSNNINDIYKFSFYVDYESPVLKNATFTKEYDRVNKEYRYYANLEVFDNHYVQSVRPIVVYTNSQTNSNTYASLSENPIPVYQTNKGESTIVKVEITDYIDIINNLSNNKEVLAFYVDDYAMNSSIFQVNFPSTDSKNIAFTEDTLTINQNDTVNLADYMTIKGQTEIEKDYLKNLTWESTNTSVVSIINGQIEGLKEGSATIYCTSKTTNTKISIIVNVSSVVNNDNPSSSANASLTKLAFDSYTTLFAFEGDYDYSKIGSTGSLNFLTESASATFYPTESIKLHYNMEPWNIDPSRYELTYVSSNPRVATVDEDGVVTGVSEGKARITMKITIDGKESPISARLSVVIKDPFIVANRTLMEYKGAGGVVTIPDDRGILYVGSFAFAHYNLDNTKEANADDFDSKKTAIGNDTITKVIVPEGIEEIYKYAFYNCSALQEVVLPSSIKKVNEYAFYNDVKLETINLENVIVVGTRAFYNCERLNDINLNKVNTIGDEGFYNCKYVTSANLTELKRAGKSGFANCVRLTTVILGPSTQLGDNFFENTKIGNVELYGNRIPDGAFLNCKKLVSFVAHNDLVYIGENAFSGCSALSNVVFDKGVEYISSRAFYNTPALKNFTMPSGDVEIADYAFENAGITNLIFSADTNLSHVGVSAFTGCANLTKIYASNSMVYAVDSGNLYSNDMTVLYMIRPGQSITNYTLPNTVEVIGENAFINSNITTFTVPAYSKLKEIKANAFAECTSLQSVSLNNNKITIDEFAFYNCTALTSINLENVESIGDYAFTNTKLNNITLADDITVGTGAFYLCTSLKTATIGKNAVLNDSAFQQSGVSTVNLGDNTTVNNSVFYRCTSLKNIDLTKVSGELGEAAFFYCLELEKANLANVTLINNYAFADCVKLVEVSIPQVTSLGESVFAQYASGSTGAIFTSIVLPSCLTSIGNDCFYGCSKLESIDLSNVETVGTQAFAYCSSLANVTIGSKIKTISESLFFSDSLITSLDLENVETFEAGCLYETSISELNITSAKIIEDKAFYGLSKVTKVNAPLVEKVGQYGFYGCTSLEEITLPKVQTIGLYAFYGSKISEFMITENLKSVEYMAFFGTLNLKSFYAMENGEKVTTCTFENTVLDEGVLYVKLANDKYLLSVYPYAKEEKEYSVIDNTVRIEYYCSSGNRYIEKLVLPNSLKVIGNLAFYGSSSLKEIVFNSYYAPVLEGTMTVDTVPTADTFVKFNELYKYDFYYLNVGQVLSVLYYQNFNYTLGEKDTLTYVYPKNSEGYTSLLYKAYFNDKVDENNVRIDSGDTISGYAYKFIDGVTLLPDTLSWKEESMLDDLMFYYNYLLDHNDEMKDVPQSAIDKFLSLKEMVNVSLVEKQIDELYYTYNSEYVYNRLKNAYISYNALTDAEKSKVNNYQVLDDKIKKLSEDMEEEINFDKSYSEYKNAYRITDQVQDKKSNLGLILGLVFGGVALVALCGVLVVILKKKKAKKVAE